MIANQSNLSSLGPGYDAVVAITLESVNSALYEYIDNINTVNPPLLAIEEYYWRNKNDQSEAVTRENLLSAPVSNQQPSGTNQIDPANVQSWTEVSGSANSVAEISAIRKSSFDFGFKAKIGIPKGYALTGAPNPANLPVLPPMISMDSGGSNMVVVRLYCSEFQIFWVDNQDGHLICYNNISQKDGDAWILTTFVSLKTLTDNSNLPTAVTDETAKLLQNSFSIQKLVLDIDAQTTTKIPENLSASIPQGSPLNNFFRSNFAQLYNAVLNHVPAIGYAVISNSVDTGLALNITAVQPVISPFTPPDNSLIEHAEQLATLNYICSQNTPPENPSPFRWNWLDDAGAAQCSGVVAVNRKVLARLVYNQLESYITGLCNQIVVEVKAEDFLSSKVNYSWNFVSGQTPTVTYPDSGSTVLNVNYTNSASDKATNAIGATVGSLELHQTYSLKLDFSENIIQITQSMIIEINVSNDGSDPVQGSIVNTSIVDNYLLNVTESGALSIVRNNSSRKDQPGLTLVTGLKQFFNNVNQLATNINTSIQKLNHTQINSIPLTPLQSFIFPGGNSFVYKDVTFSDFQDLVARITYVQAAVAPPTVVPPVPNPVPPILPPPVIPHPPKDPSDPGPQPTNPTAPAGTGKEVISYTSELMRNYAAASVMEPHTSFEALQDSSGHSLLFSIGTDGVFWATQETSGQSASGWLRSDLSSVRLKKDSINFTLTELKKIKVNQNRKTGAISLAMVVQLNGKETLYVCQNNSSTDLSWLKNPVWIPCDYDNTAEQKFEILNVFIYETDKVEYVVVDVTFSNNSPRLVDRYYVYPSSTQHPKWVSKSIAVNIDSKQPYSSCLGRRANADTDGIYTFGTINGLPQFVYEPLTNNNVNVAATSNPLKLANNSQPQAMVAFRNGNSDESTDLFVCSNGQLFHLPSNLAAINIAEPILSNPLFVGVKSIYATLNKGIVTVWAHNDNGAVFYTSSPYVSSSVSGQIINQNWKWTTPVVLLKGISQVSPFINLANNGNTIFAAGEDILSRLSKSPETGIWKSSQVTLPPPPGGKASFSFHSYTTRIQVMDSNNRELANTAVKLSANTRTAFYINNLYTVLDKTPREVKTDALGVITLIEAVASINGAILTITTSNQSVTIHPMDNAYNKLNTLNTESALDTAQVNLQNGSSSKLVKTNDTPTLTSVAQGIPNFVRAYTHAKLPQIPSNTVQDNFNQTAGAGMLLDIGDFFQLVKNDFENIGQSVQKDFRNDWHYVTHIAGQEYRYALNTVDKIAAAVESFMSLVIADIEQLLQYLSFLFDLDDIKRTKKVISNVTQRFLYHQQHLLSNFKASIDKDLQTIENDLLEVTRLKKLKGIQLPDPNRTTGSSYSSIQHYLNAANSFLSHHFHFNSSNSSLPSLQLNDTSTTGFDALNEAIVKEANVFNNLTKNLHTLFGDISNLTFEQLLTDVAAIIAIDVIAAVEIILNLLIDFLMSLTSELETFFTQPFHIPVISNILSDFGVETNLPSLLEVFSWIGAVPSTMIYKVLMNEAPYAENNFTTNLIQFDSFAQIKTAFGTGTTASPSAATNSTTNAQSTPQANAAMAEMNSASVTDTNTEIPIGGGNHGSLQGNADVANAAVNALRNNTFYCIGHTVSGITNIINGFVNTLSVAMPVSENPFSTPAAVLGVLGAVFEGAADYLVPFAPETNETYRDVSKATTGIRLLSKAVFSGKFGGSNSTGTRKAGASVDALLVIPAAACTIHHMIALSHLTDSNDKTVAMKDEEANIASYIERLLDTAIVLQDETDSGVTLILGGLAAVAGVSCGALQINAGIDAVHPSSS